MSRRPERLQGDDRRPKKPRVDGENICQLCRTFNSEGESYQKLKGLVLCPDCFKTESRNEKMKVKLAEESRKWNPELSNAEKLLATMFFRFKFEKELSSSKKPQPSEEEEEEEEENEDYEEEEEEEEQEESGHENEPDPFDEFFEEWLNEDGSEYSTGSDVSAADMKEAFGKMLKAYVYRTCEK